MPKKLKKRKSQILQNMNPDFVNKLANIMGGRSASLNNKKSVSNTQGTAVTTKKNPKKKWKPTPPPPPLLPLPKPASSEPKPEVEIETKPIIEKTEEKIVLPTKSETNDNVEIIQDKEKNYGNEKIVKKNISIRNTEYINENYFITMKDVLEMTYKNNGDQVRCIMELNEFLESKKNNEIEKTIPKKAIEFLLWGIASGLITGSIITSLWFL